MSTSVKNVIFIANIEWNFLKQRHQFFAEELSKLGLNVIFIESSAKRNPTLKDIPRIFSRLKKVVFKSKSAPKKDATASAKTDVKVVTPLVLPSTNSFFNLLNDLIFTKKLVSSVKSQLVDGKTAIINYLPSHTSIALTKQFSADVLVYDCVSNFEYVPGMPSDVVKTEDELIELCNLVFYDCNFLLGKHEKKAKKNVLIEPGVEIEKFRLNLHSKKIENILYFGLLSEKNDIELVQEVAGSFKLDLLGEHRVDISELGLNQFIPSVPHAELPEYISKYDALLLPYKTTEYAKGVIPAKFFECLATGLPVISSATPNFLDYKDFLIIGEKGSYGNLIGGYSDTEESRMARISLAEKNNWKDKTKQILDLINAEL